MASAPKTAAPASAVDMSEFNPAGINVKYRILDGVLFLAIPVSEAAIKSARPSTSGKSKTVGSSLGNVSVPGTALKFGVNVYVPNSSAT